MPPPTVAAPRPKLLSARTGNGMPATPCRSSLPDATAPSTPTVISTNPPSNPKLEPTKRLLVLCSASWSSRAIALPKLVNDSCGFDVASRATILERKAAPKAGSSENKNIAPPPSSALDQEGAPTATRKVSEAGWEGMRASEAPSMLPSGTKASTDRFCHANVEELLASANVTIMVSPVLFNRPGAPTRSETLPGPPAAPMGAKDEANASPACTELQQA